MKANANQTILAIVVTALACGVVFFLSARAFTGPTQAPPSGNGALSSSGTTMSVGTSTPSASAILLVVGSTTDNSAFGLKIFDSSQNTLLSVRNDGVITMGPTTFRSSIIATGTVDTVGVCGTSPTINGANGIDHVTTGSNASSTCKITFGVAFANKPICVISEEAAANSTTTYAGLPTTTTLTIKSSVSSTDMKSRAFDVICIGQ